MPDYGWEPWEPNDGWGIYRLVSPRARRTDYIGKTTNFQKRPKKSLDDRGLLRHSIECINLGDSGFQFDEIVHYASSYVYQFETIIDFVERSMIRLFIDEKQCKENKEKYDNHDAPKLVETWYEAELLGGKTAKAKIIQVWKECVSW
jgi:hypothetical protein